MIVASSSGLIVGICSTPTIDTPCVLPASSAVSSARIVMKPDEMIERIAAVAQQLRLANLES